MTSIFTYPLQNAWVLVSDKLEANQTESQRIDSGYEIYYNFIRKHQGIGCCLCELATPALKLISANKWLDLIKVSKEIKLKYTKNILTTKV